MLKIRDGVDLKELEKFGFKELKKFYKRKKMINSFTTPLEIETKVYKKSKLIINKIIWGFYDIFNNTLGITDLIKADLVEKVDD